MGLYQTLQILAVFMALSIVHSDKRASDSLMHTAQEHELEFCQYQYPKYVPQTRQTTVNNVSVYVYEYTTGKSDSVSETLLAGKSWEDPSIKAIIAAMKAPAVSTAFDPPTFVDVGANIGWISLNVAAAGYKVVAVEALHENVVLIRNSVCANPGFRNNITILSLALGSNTSTCYMFASTVNMGNGALMCGPKSAHEALAAAPVPESPGDKFSLRGITKVRRMDDVFARHIKAMRISVEGFEAAVVKGAGNMLENQRVQSVLMEVNGPRMNNSESAIFDLLASWARYGYRVSTTGWDGPWLKGEEMLNAAGKVDAPFNAFITLDPSKLKKNTEHTVWATSLEPFLELNQSTVDPWGVKVKAHHLLCSQGILAKVLNSTASYGAGLGRPVTVEGVTVMVDEHFDVAEPLKVDQKEKEMLLAAMAAPVPGPPRPPRPSSPASSNPNATTNATTATPVAGPDSPVFVDCGANDHAWMGLMMASKGFRTVILEGMAPGVSMLGQALCKQDEKARDNLAIMPFTLAPKDTNCYSHKKDSTNERCQICWQADQMAPYVPPEIHNMQQKVHAGPITNAVDLDVQVLRIDAPGSEVFALQGAMDLMAKRHIWYVIVHVTGIGFLGLLREEQLAVLNAMHNLEYSISPISFNGPFYISPAMLLDTMLANGKGQEEAVGTNLRLYFIRNDILPAEAKFIGPSAASLSALTAVTSGTGLWVWAAVLLGLAGAGVGYWYVKGRGTAPGVRRRDK